jgi:lysine-N-methylase
LGEHVAARLYVSGATTLVLLHDTERGAVAQIGQREWTLLRHADGTRDLAGIRLAASKASLASMPDLDEIASFFESLDVAGLLGDEAVSENDAAGLSQRPPERPIESLPAYRFHCHGRGTCCRLYPTTLFSPPEVVRARAAMPKRCGAGEDPHGAFTPERGSGPLGQGAAAVAMRDGRCAYLDDDGACGIQRRSGDGAKPNGCEMFPVVLVDDGSVIRVSVSPECSCVFDSGADGGDAPLIDARVAGDLDPSVVVASLPEQITLRDSRVVPRLQYLSWRAAWLAAVTVPDEGTDAAASLWALSLRLGREAPGEPAWPRGATCALSPAIRAYLEILISQLERRVEQDGPWRSSRDMARQLSGDMLDAARLLAELPDGARLPDVVSLSNERLYLRTVIHGHQAVAERPLVEALAWRAVRLWLARALRCTASEPCMSADPAYDQPIALVEAMCRAYGLCITVPDGEKQAKNGS